jgi:hypothetical protein
MWFHALNDSIYKRSFKMTKTEAYIVQIVPLLTSKLYDSGRAVHEREE